MGTFTFRGERLGTGKLPVCFAMALAVGASLATGKMKCPTTASAAVGHIYPFEVNNSTNSEQAVCLGA